jgi:hypothetical protein
MNMSLLPQGSTPAITWQATKDVALWSAIIAAAIVYGFYLGGGR